MRPIHTLTCVAISFCADVAALINAPAAFIIDFAASRICSSKLRFSSISFEKKEKNNINNVINEK